MDNCVNNTHIYISIHMNVYLREFSRFNRKHIINAITRKMDTQFCREVLSSIATMTGKHACEGANIDKLFGAHSTERDVPLGSVKNICFIMFNPFIPVDWLGIPTMCYTYADYKATSISCGSCDLKPLKLLKLLIAGTSSSSSSSSSSFACASLAILAASWTWCVVKLWAEIFTAELGINGGQPHGWGFYMAFYGFIYYCI